MTPQYTLIRHRNGNLYALIDSSTPLTDTGRQALARDIASTTGRQVLGVASSIPTQSDAHGTNYNVLMTGFRTDANVEAFGELLRSRGDTSPNLSHPSYVMGKMPHLIYTEQIQLLEVTEPSSDVQGKIMDAIERSYKYMPGEVAERLRAVFTPENLALLASTLAIWGVAHFFGIGFLIDAILFGLALVALGAIATQGLLLLADFYVKAKNAQTEAELEEAAKVFAEAVLTIGVGATAALLTRRPVSPAARREMDAAVLSRAFSPGSGAKPMTLESVRGKVVLGKDGRQSLYGPESKKPGIAMNMTTDNAFALSNDWAGQNTFFVAAHALKNGLSFYRDVEASVPIQTRVMAIQMWKNGYRGGDIVLIACESGLNHGLVRSLFRELSGLKLERPVGTIYAPNRAINGQDVLGQARAGESPLKWEPFDFN